MSGTVFGLLAVLLVLHVLAFTQIRLLRRRPQLSRQNLIIAAAPAPPPGTKMMEVHATRRIAGGKIVRVRVESGGTALEGVEINLVNSIDQTVAASSVTDRTGRVRFKAPLVTVPTTFEVRATKAGYSTYVPPEDERAWAFQTGYYPLTEVVVWPHGPLPGLPTNTPRLWIDLGFGWTAVFGGRADMSALDAAATTAGWDFDEDWWAGRGTLCDHLKDLGPGDMWAFSGHAYYDKADPNSATALAPWRAGALVRGYARMTTQELCECFGEDGGPGLGFLDACSSHTLLQDLVDCCMKVAVGWSGPVPGTQSSAAMRTFFTTLMGGGTIAQAEAAANLSISSGFNPSTSRIVVKAKPALGVASALTLSQIMEFNSTTEPAEDR
jgi:hypothetical protein